MTVWMPSRKVAKSPRGRETATATMETITAGVTGMGAIVVDRRTTTTSALHAAA